MKTKILLLFIIILLVSMCSRKNEQIELKEKKEYIEKKEVIKLIKELEEKYKGGEEKEPVQIIEESKTDLSNYYTKGEIDASIYYLENKDYAVFEERSNPGESMKAEKKSNVFIKRKLNTVIIKNGKSILLNKDKNIITLSPGTYRIKASSPAYCVVSHQIRIRDITNNKSVLIGTSETAPGAGMQTRSSIDGIIKVTVKSQYELQHYLNLPQTENSPGIAVNSGEEEVYSRISIYKIK